LRRRINKKRENVHINVNEFNTDWLMDSEGAESDMIFSVISKNALKALKNHSDGYLVYEHHYKNRTLQSLADKMGLSRERIRQRINRVLKKVRDELNNEK
jgi:predicted DNA-binding protein (UPF0251 family)